MANGKMANNMALESTLQAKMTLKKVNGKMANGLSGLQVARHASQKEN